MLREVVDAAELPAIAPIERDIDAEAVQTHPRKAAAIAAFTRFGAWRRERPFVGGLLVALGGVEMFLSSQLDLGNLRVQLGIEGLQATIIPIMLLLLGVLAVTMPTHHIFYGVIALVIALYSIVGVNLGGFLVGMLLSTVGAVLVVAWMSPETRARQEAEATDDESAAEEPASEEPASEQEMSAADGHVDDGGEHEGSEEARIS